MALLLLAFSGKGSAQQPTTSELLQKGIYLQETVGDLDGAIRVYRQVMQMAEESRANAAQAEYRLGLCLQKKGQRSEAVSILQRLIKEHPEESEVVAKARELLGADSKPESPVLLPVPWAEGEVLEYTTRNRQNSPGSKSWYSFHPSRIHTGRWLLDAKGAHVSGPFGQLAFGRVEVDQEMMKPLVSLGTQLGGKTYKFRYGSRAVEMTDDGKDVGETVVAGPVYDSVELPALLRRLPWAEGYKVSLPLLWSSGSGSLIVYEFVVSGEEDLETPAGQFHCFHVERRPPLKPSAVEEQYWISTDPAHVLVRSSFRGIITELAASPGSGPEESVYRDESARYTLTLPAGWVVDKSSNTGFMDLHSSATALVHLCPCANNATTPDALRREAEKHANQETGATVRPESWQARQVAGHAAVSWIADCNSSTVCYRVLVMTDDPSSLLLIKFSADASNFDTLRPTFDAILDSVALR
jgi:hypothetical protein